jgi:hypothetical protein
MERFLCFCCFAFFVIFLSPLITEAAGPTAVPTFRSNTASPATQAGGLPCHSGLTTGTVNTAGVL